MHGAHPCRVGSSLFAAQPVVSRLGKAFPVKISCHRNLRRARCAAVAFDGITSLDGSTRAISWNPSKWGRQDIGRSSNTQLEEELPELFANQPREVDDYLRPDKSVFERMEDFWEWAISFMQPVEKQVDLMRGLHDHGCLGWSFPSWGHVFFFYGICMRLLTLIPSLYSHRNALRMNQASPQITEITSKQNQAKNDRTLTTAEKRVIKEGYNRMKHAVLRKYRCAQWKSFLTSINAPVTLTAFLAIRRLSLYDGDLERAPFLWLQDLSLPDPTLVLPSVCAVAFVMNFELNQRMQKGGRSSTNLYIRWAVRVGAVVGIYFVSAQPSAMFAYWIGLSTAGLLQPLLLRWQPFRNFFAFPDPPQAARASILSDLSRPSIYERFFASSSERARLAARRKARQDAVKKKKFDTIEDYEVVFDKPNKK